MVGFNFHRITRKYIRNKNGYIAQLPGLKLLSCSYADIKLHVSTHLAQIINNGNLHH